MPALPIEPFFTTDELASLMQANLGIYDSAVPRHSISDRPLSALSFASTDTAYSHASHHTETPLVTSESVPSLFSEEDTDDDSGSDRTPTEERASSAESLAASWLVLDAACVEKDWECVHIQDGLLPPPPSTISPLRKTMSIPAMSLSSASLATLVLLSLTVPTVSGATMTSGHVAPVALDSPPPTVSWIPRKPWPYMVAALILALCWLSASRFASPNALVSELGDLAAGDLVLLSYPPPPEASESIVPIHRTVRTSGHPREHRMWSNEGPAKPLRLTSPSTRPGRVRFLPSPTAVAISTTVILAVSAQAASPVPSDARSGSMPLLWPTIALFSAILVPMALWNALTPTRIESKTASGPLDMPRTRATPSRCKPSQAHSAAYLSNLAFVPAAMASPAYSSALAFNPFNLAASNRATYARKVHPAAIMAIVLGLILFPFALLAVGEAVNLCLRRRSRLHAVRHTRPFRYACIAAGIMLGLAIGLILTPIFAVYMLAVFVAAVTASYGRYAGLNTSEWWQGQTPEWPARLARTPSLPTNAQSQSLPRLTPLLVATRVGEKRDKWAYTPEGSPDDAVVPLPVYPAPVYARSAALIVLFALALPCSASPGSPSGVSSSSSLSTARPLMTAVARSLVNTA